MIEPLRVVCKSPKEPPTMSQLFGAPLLVDCKSSKEPPTVAKLFGAPLLVDCKSLKKPPTKSPVIRCNMTSVFAGGEVINLQ